MGGRTMALFSQTIRSVLFKWADFQTDLIPKRMRYEPLPKHSVRQLCCGLFAQDKGGTSPEITNCKQTCCCLVRRPVCHSIEHIPSFLLSCLDFCRTNLIKMTTFRVEILWRKKKSQNPQDDKKTRRVKGASTSLSWVHICSCLGF